MLLGHSSVTSQFKEGIQPPLDPIHHLLNQAPKASFLLLSKTIPPPLQASFLSMRANKSLKNICIKQKESPLIPHKITWTGMDCLLIFFNTMIEDKWVTWTQKI